MKSFQTLFIFQEIKGFYISELNSIKGIEVVYARAEKMKSNRVMLLIKGLIEGE